MNELSVRNQDEGLLKVLIFLSTPNVLGASRIRFPNARALCMYTVYEYSLVDCSARVSHCVNPGKCCGRAISHAGFIEELLVESAPYAWHASALYHLLCVVLSLHAWRELWPEAPALDARAVMELRTEEDDMVMATVYRNPAPTPVSMRSHAQPEHSQHLNQLSAATPTTHSPMTALSQAACSEGEMAALVTCPGRVARSRSAVGQGAGPNALAPRVAATLGLGLDSSDTDSESSSDELAGALFQVNTTSALQPAFSISGTTSADTGGRGNRYRLALDLLLGLFAVALTALHVSLFQLLANRAQRDSIYVALLESLFCEGALHLVTCAALLVILVYTQARRHSRSKDVAFSEEQRAAKRGRVAAVSGLHQGLVYVAAIGLFLLAFLNMFAVRAELDTLTTALNTLNALLLCAHCSLTVLLLMSTSPLYTSEDAGASRSMAVGTRALALVLAAHLLVEVGSALPRAILLFGGGQASASATSSQIAPAMAIALTPIGSLFHALAALHLSGLFPHAKRVQHPLYTP